MARSPSTRRLSVLAVAALGGAGLLVGCGGGGSGGGSPRPSPGFHLGTPPTVQELETPIGLAGSRGSGADVFVSLNLRDREYNPCSIQVEYGYDVDGDGVIAGSDGDPATTDEYFECTPAANPGDGMTALDSASGRGADHLFIWASGHDLAGIRLVTQDYDYTEQGRLKIGSDGQPLFGNTPGTRLRVRANDDGGANGRWGPWKVGDPFDLNNNSQPALVIEAVGLDGATPNATGAAADENVVLNFRIIDADANAGTDLNAVAVDYAPVAPGADLSDPAVVDALAWLPATTAAGTPDTGLLSEVAPGALNTWTWDSVADVGTVNGDYILRITPFDSKQERGATVMMPERFRLDNYTIFTDAGAALSAPRVGHRATTLLDGRVLVSGGRTTAAGASVSTAEIFYPGIGQTTYGAVAAAGSLNTARSWHSQTRLQDDTVLVAGGYDASGNPLSSMELYDPATGAWTTMGVNLGTARARHTAVLLANGDVLFAGGVDGSGALASAAVYHADTDTVTAAGSMTAARHSVTGALLPDGRVLLPGGKDSAGAALASTELFDPAVGTFSAGPAMSSARAEHAVAAMTDGRVLVSGGVGLDTISIYDRRTNTWDNTAPLMSTERAGHTGVLMGDGRILMAGGSNGTAVVGSANLFDPATGGYDAPNGGMLSAHRDAATVVLNNGRALVIGGLDTSGATLADIEIFTPDGGFNYVPTAKILSPQEPQSWAFGALFACRLIDPESDPAKVIFQYSVSGGAWRTCTSKGGAWDDGVADTIAGDVNEGLVDLATTDADSALPIDPVFKNTAGDHLFVWDMAADLSRADYDSVRVRVIPFGAARGVMATSNPFKIAFNTRVIPRFSLFTGSVSGTVDIDYHLQDIDGALPLPDPAGDGARVEFDFGIDGNGDGQILDIDGESWVACTAAPGGDGLGAGYTLATTKAFNPTVGTAGWHVFLWDSVRDLGSPVVGETRSDVILRITPYDFPAGSEESIGRQETMGVDQGLTLVLDPNGLYLVSWGTEGGQTWSGSTLGNVKLDETLVFTFNREVDPATVDGAVGLATLPVTVGGRTILGAYQADPTDYTVVRFFPQVNGSTDGVLTWDGSEDPTVLTRGVSASVRVVGYQAGTDPETASILRIRGWAAGAAAVEIANLLDLDHAPGIATSSAAGTSAYFARGTAPAVTSATPADGATGVALTSGLSVQFDLPLWAEGVDATTLRFVVDLDGDGTADANDSVIPGTCSLVNTVGPAGVRKAVVTFTPLAGLVLPAGAKILADFSAVVAGDGTATADTGSSFTTVPGGVSTAVFAESFDDDVNKDADATTALWNATGFAGMLTGLRDGGTGADGTPSPDSTVGSVLTFSSKSTWNFTGMAIPVDKVWRFTGGGTNSPVSILVTGSVDIAGVLDVSGSDGIGSESQHPTSNSYSYVMAYSSSQTTGTNAFAGGTAVAGGGAGAPSVFQSAGKAGQPGTGGTAASAGGGAAQGSSYSGGGGGAGHAQGGQKGGRYSATISTSYGDGGIAGTSYGGTTFSTGISAGSGGGSGGSYSSVTYSSPYYYHRIAGSGGGGGGAVKVVSNGSFTLRGSGVIDASGGDGGNGWAYGYGGSGGAGSGGSVWVIAGGDLALGGIIDVRGGRGGEVLYYKGSYAQGSPVRYGSFGGHGSAGRVRIEAPNVGTTTTDFVAGAAFGTIASADLDGGSGTLGSFPVSTTVNIDTIPKDGSGFMNFTTMNIPSGTTVTLTGTSAAKMRFTGNVSISGVLRSNGNVGANGVYTSGASAAYATMTAASGGAGGGAGGIPNSSGSSTLANGGAGSGAGGGGGGIIASGYNSGTTYYYYGGSGGGGASNLLNLRGRPGGKMKYGAVYYGTKAGGAAGAGATDPGAMTLSNLTGGSGGGSGANGRYVSSSNYYNQQAGGGGGGGGGIGIETDGSFTLGSTGRIEVLGGKGGFGYTYPGGGGGGASGGNVLIRGSTVTFTSGSKIDTTGGAGERSYPSSLYYEYGNDGGDGGIGAVRVESVTAAGLFNAGGILGYSASTGSLTTAYYATGDTGATTWQTAAGLAPDFRSQVINAAGSMEVRLEGAMTDPVTGLRSTTNTGAQDIKATPLTTGLGAPDSADGYRFFRLVWKLQPPSSANGYTLPSVFDTSVTIDTR